MKDGLPEPEEDEKGNFCMAHTNGEWTLKRNHSYYFQVQLQMVVCKVNYYDFIVWTEKEYAIERIALIW